MSIFLGIFVSILVFSIIILVHEYGHFKSARIFGVKVEEFGLGIPPRCKKLWKDRLGTIYTLNWLPLGGFVRLKGESPSHFLIYDKDGKLIKKNEIQEYLELTGNIYSKNGELIAKKYHQKILTMLEQEKGSDNLYQASFIGQLCIIFAGVTMNFLLAIIIFWALFIYGIQPLGINTKIPTSSKSYILPTYQQALTDGVLIKKEGVRLFPIDGSIAQKGGIREGDIAKSINNISIFNSQEFIEKMQTSSGSVKISIQRASEGKNINIDVFIIPDNTKKIGSYVGENIEYNEDFRYKFGFLEGLKVGIYETATQSALTFKALYILGGKIISPSIPTERSEAIQELSGPIGVVNIISKSMEYGLTTIFILGAIISINLGVFNLLPIPALDGGRGLLIIINKVGEKIVGKKILGFWIENSLHIFFLVLLVALSIYIGYNDTVKLLK